MSTQRENTEMGQPAEKLDNEFDKPEPLPPPQLVEPEWENKELKVADSGRAPLASLFEGLVHRAWQRGEIDNVEKLMLLEAVPVLDGMVHVFRMGKKVGYERGKTESLNHDWRVLRVRDMLGKDSPL